MSTEGPEMLFSNSFRCPDTIHDTDTDLMNTVMRCAEI